MAKAFAAFVGGAVGSVSIRSGAIQIDFEDDGSYTLVIDGQIPVGSAPLSVFALGETHTASNGGLNCGQVKAANGSDRFGSYNAAELDCTVKSTVPAIFSWRAYGDHGKIIATLSLPAGANGTTAQPDFNIHQSNPAQFAPFPAFVIEGAFNTSAFLCYGGDKSHLYSAYSISGGDTGISSKHLPPSCHGLGNGPATMLWPRAHAGGIQALVGGPADSFHLNYNTIASQGAQPEQTKLTAKLWYDAARGDVTLCMTDVCNKAQSLSNYSILSEDEGTFDSRNIPPPGMPGANGAKTPIFFSWSATAQDNWVTNSSACPEASYTNCGNADGFLYSSAAQGRIEVLSYSNGKHHIAAATAASKAWAEARDYTATASLGYLDAPVPPLDVCALHAGVDYVCCDLRQVHNVSGVAGCCAACKADPDCNAWKLDMQDPKQICYLKRGPLTNPVKVASTVVVGFTQTPKPSPRTGPAVWSFGVSGDVLDVPVGFKQSTMLIHSTLGANAAWDYWGSSIRQAYATVKKTDEDIFLAALSIWTDNGAATLGAAWRPKGAAKPPPYTQLGPNVSYMNWNWTMVDEEVLGKVADDVRGKGVAPRATQLDCWWYPVQTGGAAPGSTHPFWCVSDWVLPEPYYPDGAGGVRKRMGVPLMMYFPALCVENAWNVGGKYRFSDTAKESGFLVPISEQSEEFWGDMFDYGAAQAARGVDPSADVWPGVWAPPQVLAGWKGTNLAGYETDFYHNIVLLNPELRQEYGAGERFLNGIHLACDARNMTAQLCAGNPPSFLEALTMPTITNARASIDYDWDGAPAKNSGTRSNNGPHNWAAADNGWVFWATRIAPSKDNFWTSFRDLFKDGGSQDSGRNGKDAELHAIAAILSTGPVGLGDTCVGTKCMTNATLVKRLAREDGILLRPDRPMVPMDVQWGGLLGSVRAMPGLCTPAQEQQGPSASCGARLWSTHATVYPEDLEHAPELARAPTRRLVSHAGVDASLHSALPEALSASTQFLLQYLVVSVDQPDSFLLQPADLYPLPSNGTQIFWRSATDGGQKCIAGSDAVASGCVGLAPAAALTTSLFEVSTAGSSCSQARYTGGVLPAGPNCLHEVSIWQVWSVEADAEFVLLGDLSAYVSLSGYRFRLPASAPEIKSTTGESLVVVGMPKEKVNITYLRKSSSGRWMVSTQEATIAEDGRASVKLE